MLAQDMHFEEEISRNPYHLKTWLQYLTFKVDEAPSDRYVIYERALIFLPRSYKLWHAYLAERTHEVESLVLTAKEYVILLNAYERALVHMNKMPRIWLDYCKLLMSMHKGTFSRRTFDRALKALPVTQHDAIWDLYIQWAKEFGVSDTIIRVYNRYLMFEPRYREEFVEYLLSIDQYAEAAQQLQICLNSEHYVSPSGRTHHQMWMQLCDICSSHAADVVNVVKFDAIIRSGISRFSDEVGRLWNSLADYYIRLGLFEKARDIYEEAIASVTTVRDFTIVFDAYVKVEESVLTTKIRFLQEADEDEEGAGEALGPEDAAEREAEANDINMRLARIEYLMEKRPLMLNSVVLRQNPHNVHEWHKRAKLHKGEPARFVQTLLEAIKIVDMAAAVGRPSTLYLSLAKHYESQEDFANSRAIFSAAADVNYKTVDELANVVCAAAEFEMRIGDYDAALAIMKQAITEPTLTMKRRKAQAAAQGQGRAAEQVPGLTSQDKLHKNIKVWGLYLDLEESLCSVDSCKAAYERVMDLKVITAQMCLNFASFLYENHYFEDCFQVYEKSVALFIFPQVRPIWLAYMDQFMARYEGSKLERLRDIFEKALAGVPPEDCAEFYIKYAKAEEQYGTPRHAMAVYDRACAAVPDASTLDMYRLYVKKVDHYFGITKTRPIYERAIRELGDNHSRAMCLEFSAMERKLGEVDRARSILQYGSQFADPRREPAYWQTWREFEESHGNEDTFREMLWVQRSVETAFSQMNYLAAEMLAGTEGGGSFVPASTSATSSAALPLTMDEMDRQAELEAEGGALAGFVGANQGKRKFAEADLQEEEAVDAAEQGLQLKRQVLKNDDEIDI